MCANYINLSGAALALILGGFAYVYLKTSINRRGKEGRYVHDGTEYDKSHGWG